MTPGSHRVLKRAGRVALIETSNRAMGTGYSVRIGRLGLWSGDNLVDAEKEFAKATESAGD